MRNLNDLYGSKRNALTVNWAMTRAPLRLDLTGQLLDADDHELRGLQRREPDEDVHDPEVDVVLGGGLRVDLDEVRLPRRLPLEGSLPEQVLHERPDVEAQLRPQR